MTLASEREIRRVRKEKRYWSALTKLLGWRLYGWSYCDRASFILSDDHLVEITALQRDNIVKAIEERTR